MGVKEYLVDKKKEIKDIEVKERENEITKTKSFATVIVGPRRAGKSFFLYHIIKKENLDESSYLFVNFEDYDVKFEKKEEKTKIVKYHIEEYKKEPEFIFLDEIQNLENWESFLYSLIEKKRYYIFVTGSNSKVLSKEIATQLRGRCITKVIFPFNFREFLRLKGLKIEEHISSYEISKIKGYLKDFLLFSGFPTLLMEKIKPKQFFQDYVDVVIYRDLVERYSIQNVFLLKYLIIRAISQFSSEISLNKIYNELKSQGIKVGKSNIYLYISYLEDVMFSFLLRKFSFREREHYLSIPKIYLCDQGFPNFLLKTKISENFGKLMENCVFLELKKNEIESKNISLFYFKDYQQNEVDFLIKENLEIKQLIQVTYASSKDEIERREIKSLIKASELLKCNDLLIITWDYEDEIKENNKVIKCIPLWKWLLNFGSARS